MVREGIPMLKVLEVLKERYEGRIDSEDCEISWNLPADGPEVS